MIGKSNKTRIAICRVAGLMITGVLSVAGEETRCTGTITGSHDNVVVPQGAVCVLNNADLNGSVYVYRGGGITISGLTYINGNVISEDGGAYVRITGRSVTVGGNVQIKYNYQTSSLHPGTSIQGSLQYVENTGYLSVSGVFIGSDLQLFKNTGGASLTRNTIRQNMQC
ncbi:MAG: hypothetical protein H7039_00390, partial [Bryobacteraceae bacterium]|nr:hypothetical protein [Bryobacteraceae bacterium]